jgi:hypothetical protein
MDQAIVIRAPGAPLVLDMEPQDRRPAFVTVIAK